MLRLGILVVSNSDEGAFCYLNRQRLRAKSGVDQRKLHLLHQTGTAQMPRIDIHVYRGTRKGTKSPVPFCHLAARLVQHPPVAQNDEIALLGNEDELARENNEAAFGLIPANQCFKAGNARRSMLRKSASDALCRGLETGLNGTFLNRAMLNGSR